MSSTGRNLPAPYLGPPSGGAAGLEVVDLLRVLWRRRAAMGMVIVGVVVLAYGIVDRLSPRYTAEAALVLEVAEGKPVDLESVVAGLNKDAALINSEMDVLRSRGLVERVVDELDLMRDAEFNAFLPSSEPSLLVRSSAVDYLPGALRAWLKDRMADPNVPSERVRATVVKNVQENLFVENDGESYTVRLYFEAGDPTKAARIANAFADLYLTDRLVAKQKAIERTGTWLKDKLESLRQRVTAADQAVEEFRKQHQIIAIGDDGTLIKQQLERLGAELADASIARARPESVLQEIRKAGSGYGRFTASQIAGSPLVQELRSQEYALLTELAELRADFGPRHARVIETENKLRVVQNGLEQETAQVLSELEADVRVARTQEQALQSQLEDLEGKRHAADRAAIQLRQLTSEADAARSIFDAFVDGFNRTSAEVGGAEPDARILSRAIPPLSPSYPPRTLLMLLTIVAAVLLALVAVAVLELMDRGYRNPVDLERAHGVPVLGLIPVTRRRGSGPGHPSFDVIERPLSRFTEAVQSVCASLAYTQTQRAAPKVILITSATPDEGKTTFAITLGRLAARAGRRVLLIDCDLRRPCIGRDLGQAGSPGLMELVEGRARVEEALCVDKRSGMVFLPATGPVPFPAEVLTSATLHKLLAVARKEFDMVILDSPPIGIISDALVLSKLADATLLTVRWGKTPRLAVAAAVRKLAASKPVTGAVFSHVDLKRCAAYGYYPIASSERYFADLEAQWEPARRHG